MDHHHRHTPAPDDQASMIEMLDLDSEVLHAYHSDVLDWVHELAGAPGRILDLGSGSGTGTLALARRFPAAEVTALDVSRPMLDHLDARARDLGVGDRIHTVVADLDAQWPDLDPVDLVWAALSMHHMADPDRVLAEAFATLRPGGVLVMTEMDGMPRFLPDDLGIGRPGLEARSRAILDVAQADALPHLGADWGPRLTEAGFPAPVERSFVVEMTRPLPAGTGRYAQLYLQRIRTVLDDRAGADDLATLDTLIHSDGPDGVRRRDDLVIRTTRTVWAARRP